jgi:DNA polymerase phi
MASIKEKNNEFLNAFWELASDDKDKRIVSAKYIISHVQEGEKKGSSVDTDYALKRLVRGLGSSRDSARQGFATCLAELLKVGTQIGIEKTIALIDENTKVSEGIRNALMIQALIMLFRSLDHWFAKRV